jgi:hypothetical protein
MQQSTCEDDMIYLGTMKGTDANGKVKVEIPDVGIGYFCIVNVDPDDNFQIGDQLALCKVNGSRDEFYVVGKFGTSFDPSYNTIANATNLNTVVIDGTYLVATDATAATLVNAPDVTAGFLRVYKGEAPTWLIQTYMAYSPSPGTGNAYSRGYNGTTWSSWRRIVTSVDTFGPSGSLGTLDTALTTLDTRLDSLEPRMTAAEGTIVSHTNWLNFHDIDIAALDARLDSLEPRVTTAEGEINTLQSDYNGHEVRLDTLETFASATKKWSVTLPSNWDTSSSSLIDVTGLTVTVPTVTGGEYVVFLTMCIETTSSTTPSSTFVGAMNINAVNQDEQIVYRPGALVDGSASGRVTQAQTYFYTSSTTGNKIFKARASSTSLVYRLSAIHTNIKVIRFD